MSDDKGAIVYCTRIEDMEIPPVPGAIAIKCQEPDCEHMIWVAPSSFLIALEEGENSKIICMNHVEQEHIEKMIIHDLQMDELKEHLPEIKKAFKEKREEI